MIIYPEINFFFEEDFLKGTGLKASFKRKVKALIKRVLSTEETGCSLINTIFCNDEYIIEYNKKYLKHDYATDIITFEDTDEEGSIQGQIMISTDTVQANAERFNVSFERELERVIIHGVLHLSGYKDKTSSEKRAMRAREEHYLNEI